MSYSKKHHLRQNVEVIKQLLSLETLEQKATPEQLNLFRHFSGFGALKCVLLPTETEEDKRYWSKSELELFPLVQELHHIVRNSTSSEQEYKEYINSIKNAVLTAFYTPTEIVKSIATSLSEAGMQVQNILDPSAGATGQFVQDFKAVFPQSNIVAFEKDLISGEILQRLYPDEKIHVAGFETIPASNNNRFDVVTSNIPFGDISIPDTAFHLSKEPTRQLSARHIHNYFFIRGMDTLRDGGILAFITSQGVADAPTNKPIREWLMSKANLISAIRLPNNLFLENAGTEVSSDLIILQKNPHKTQFSDSEKQFIETTQTKAGIGINKYVYNRANLIFTNTKIDKDLYGKPAVILTHSGNIADVAGDLKKNLVRDFSERLNHDLYRLHTPAVRVSPQPQQGIKQEPSKQAKSSEPLMTLYDLFGLSQQERSQVKTKRNTKSLAQQQKILPEPPKQVAYTGIIAGHYKPGSLVQDEQAVGILSKDEDGNFIFNPLQLHDKKDKIIHYINFRDTYYNLYSTEQTTQIENRDERERLNQLYDE
ncbi:MAG: SAM-dependent methyltransferase, partial [Prevotellaceae bacterium]|nr:SAM-dependent methyltransferase [Prevotellaceae bacterium]